MFKGLVDSLSGNGALDNKPANNMAEVADIDSVVDLLVTKSNIVVLTGKKLKTVQ